MWTEESGAGAGGRKFIIVVGGGRGVWVKRYVGREGAALTPAEYRIQSKEEEEEEEEHD